MLFQVMLSTYPYDIKFAGTKITQENYFNKGEKDVLKRWSSYFVKRSLAYLQEGIYRDAVKILPRELGDVLAGYLSNDYDDEKRMQTMVRFFELDLKFIYASVLSATGQRDKPVWQNVKMIHALKQAGETIRETTVAESVKSEIHKLLSPSLIESLEALQEMRNTFAHNPDTAKLTPELTMHFANLVLHNNYFHTNPLVYIEYHEFKGQKLHVRAQKLTGAQEPYPFDMERGAYIENKKIYQLFDDSSENIVSLDHYIKRDPSKSTIALKVG
jgi:hypothetical protein